LVIRSESISCKELEDARNVLWTKFSQLEDFENDSEVDENIISRSAFAGIVTDTVFNAFKQGDSAENVTMEIKSLKFAHNKQFSDCLSGAFPALIDVAISSRASTGNKIVSTMNSVKKVISKDSWGYKILKALTLDQDDEYSLIALLLSLLFSIFSNATLR
jgi:hypothetical protein